MKARHVLIVTVLLIGWAVVKSLLPGEETSQRRMADSARSAEHQRPPVSHAEKTAVQRPDSQLADSGDSKESAKENPAQRIRLGAAEAVSVQPPSAAQRRREAPVGKRKNEPPGSQFNGRVLADLDYSPRTIQSIRTLWEQASAEENDRAERSGGYEWTSDDPRNTEIRDALRSDLGDDRYDAMLYATNQANRVQIGNVVDTSPAAKAGLRIKDVIVIYDGERIFDPAEAKRLSESSDPGKMIEVRVQRDGEQFQTAVAGGGLGVRYFPDWQLPTRD